MKAGEKRHRSVTVGHRYTAQEKRRGEVLIGRLSLSSLVDWQVPWIVVARKH